MAEELNYIYIKEMTNLGIVRQIMATHTKPVCRKELTQPACDCYSYNKVGHWLAPESFSFQMVPITP